MTLGQSIITPGELASLINDYQNVFLLLDYDGTLVPIAPTPGQARPGKELLGLLDRITSLPGRQVAVISGRSLLDLERLLPLPQLYLAGGHGGEYRYPGGRTILDPAVEIASPRIKDLLPKVEALLAGSRGFLVEDKGHGLSLHYRLAEPQEAREVVIAFKLLCRDLLAEGSLDLLEGKKVVELRPRGVNKGNVVKLLLGQAQDMLPVYIGDDTTDEDAFRVLAGLGPTVKVSAYPGVSQATYFFPRQADVIAFLNLLT